MSAAEFATFGDVYNAVLGHLTGYGQAIRRPGAHRAREALNVCFTLTDPQEWIISVPARRANIVFCYAEALWYLLGRDDLAMIGYYAPQLRSIPGARPS